MLQPTMKANELDLQKNCIKLFMQVLGVEREAQIYENSVGKEEQAITSSTSKEKLITGAANTCHRSQGETDSDQHVGSKLVTMITDLSVRGHDRASTVKEGHSN